jgi:predicted transcriptional regulator
MSIHPEYAEALLSGAKKVEFRRVAPKADVGYVVVYATMPIGAILGILRVDFVDHDSPTRLWRRHGGVGGISNQDFFRYFEGRCKSPLPLASVGLSDKPPQSFMYLDDEAFDTIASAASVVRRHVRRPAQGERLGSGD